MKKRRLADQVTELELSEARQRNHARTHKAQPAHMVELIAFRKSGKKAKRAKCEICGLVVSGKHLHIDHCHATGSLRGYLCRKCNLGIGMFNDSIFLLGLASKYLIKHKQFK